MLDVPLVVERTFSDGSRCVVGELAGNRDGCFFQFDQDYLAQHGANIAPFNLRSETGLQRAPTQPHYPKIIS